MNKEKILKLRDMTGLSLPKCKEALIEANWDVEKAWWILYKKYRPRGHYAAN